MSAKRSYQIKIKDSCPKDISKLIQQYWDYDVDNKQFKYGLKAIADSNKMQPYNLTSLIRQYSLAVIEKVCDSCKEVVVNFDCTSQTYFRSQYNSKFKTKCNSCKEQEEKRKEKIRLDNIKREQELIVKCQGIVNAETNFKTVVNLDVNSKYLLRKILNNIDNNRAIISFIYNNNHKISWRELNKLEKLNLVFVIRDGSYIKKIICSENLEQIFKEVDAYIDSKNISDDSFQNFEYESSINNRLSNRLTFGINKNPIYLPGKDRPIYSGITRFNGEITIKPNEVYSYAIWDRRDGSKRVTLVPLKEVVEAKESSICDLPKPVRDKLDKFWLHMMRFDEEN